MAASFINYRDKARVQPTAFFKEPKWTQKVEMIPHLQQLLRENQSTSGASQIYNDKSHWYSITGINSVNQQTPISAFTGIPSGKMYSIHGGVGKLVAQQLQKPNKIWVGINGHRLTESILVESGKERCIDSRKHSIKYEFMQEKLTENMSVESSLIPLSIEDQMTRSNVKIINFSPQEEIPPQVESGSCPFDPHSWNQDVQSTKELGVIHSFSSVNSQSTIKSHGTSGGIDTILEDPVKVVRKATKSQNKQIYLLSDDGTTKRLEMRENVKRQPAKSVIMQICELDVSNLQNNVTSAGSLSRVDKFIKNVFNITPGMICPRSPLAPIGAFLPLNRNMKESLNCKDLAGGQKPKHKDIGVTTPTKITISNKTLFHFTAKALQCSEEEKTNEKGPACGLNHGSAVPAPEADYPCLPLRGSVQTPLPTQTTNPNQNVNLDHP